MFGVFELFLVVGVGVNGKCAVFASLNFAVYSGSLLEKVKLLFIVDLIVSRGGHNEHSNEHGCYKKNRKNLLHWKFLLTKFSGIVPFYGEYIINHRK